MGFFRDGDRVRMTEAAIAAGHNTGLGKKYPHSSTGVVIGNQCGNLIKVLRDARVHASYYHAKFWTLGRDA